MKTKTEKILRENVSTILHTVVPLPTPRWNPDAPRRFSAPLPEGAAALRADTWTRSETYDGKDLRPFTGRACSMDAYKLPSKGTT